jgi:glycosyltransferase involved in cell wall biosynthesis
MDVVSHTVSANRVDGDRCPGRHVLVLDFDLYRFVGGGQSVYQRLIALRPGDTFYYFRRLEMADAPRPGNAKAIPYRMAYRARSGHLPRALAHFLWLYIECRNMAAAMRQALGIDFAFDVADAPDYNQLGLFIRPALEAEGLHVSTVAVAMHGTLSSAFRAGWPTGQSDGPMLASLRVREHLQFRAADARYAISESYAAHWTRYAPVAVNMLDPLCVVDRSQPILPERSSTPADLAFIGRREKWKGPDLFLDIAWWIDPALYRRLLLIGPDGPNHLGTGSDATLADMARRRGLQVDMAGAWPRAKVDDLFAGRTLLLLPSRQDTFNLTALEAIRHGCPVLVSSRAGVADWLRANLPELDWLITDIDCSRTAASHAAMILKDYDGYRETLVAALERRRLVSDESTAGTVYLPGSGRDVKARQTIVDLAARFALLLQLERLGGGGGVGSLRHSVGGLLPHEIKRAVRSANRSVRAAYRDTMNTVRRSVGRARLKTAVRDFAGHSPRTFIQISRSRTMPAFREWMLHGAERRDLEVLSKIGSLSREIPNRLVDRVRLFRELSRLERRAGREIVAATYALRLMRWLGQDVYGDLPFVAATLESEGFRHEARTALAMFSHGPDAFDRCLDLMHDAVERNRYSPVRPLAVVDDRRNGGAPRVSVIVSLYNAATKLGTLLTVLSQQTLAQRGELEVILVDSNSPADERGAFAAFAAENRLPIVYARTRERETIQTAWNRGIQLSRAPYLAFLGADEGLHPEALARLAAVLDADPGVDWAMADSLVTSVDRNGVFDADVMPYDRQGYRQDLVYLETCYLSWVGGLYRRSIHDRYGWYDESFRAAGDTEFKNRIMPHIRSVRVPGLLGVFNNYPEERTTQNPRAEIEDLRSWYLWRTTAGMHYAFADRPAEHAARLFVDALSYRKSFCGHVSTDFDLASALAEHLVGRPDAPAWAAVGLRESRAVLSLVRDIDLVPDDVPHGPRGALAALWVHRQLTAMRRRAARHRSLFAMTQAPQYEVFNDNRYEQHWYSWSGR